MTLCQRKAATVEKIRKNANRAPQKEADRQTWLPCLPRQTAWLLDSCSESICGHGLVSLGPTAFTVGSKVQEDVLFVL